MLEVITIIFLSHCDKNTGYVYVAFVRHDLEIRVVMAFVTTDVNMAVRTESVRVFTACL